MMETAIRKKVALITGASSGIGKAFAELLASEDYDLVLVSRNVDELNRIAGMEMTRNQTKVIPISLDLTELHAVDKLVGELAERGISPDVVINNAGVGLVGEVCKLEVEAQLKMIDLNVRAMSDVAMKLLPEMLARNSGGIINVSSVVAFLPGPYMSVYYASKAFVQSFSDSLAEELKDTKVQVMALCPGPVDTAFQATAGLDTERWFYKLLMPKTPESVAQAGWAGYKAGNRVVFPGLAELLTAWAGKMLPKLVLRPFIKLLQKPKQG